MKSVIYGLSVCLIFCFFSLSRSLGQSTPISFYIKGTGLNRSSSRILIIGGNEIYNASSGRGLRLTVLNKSNQTVISDATYDTYGSYVASNNLAMALEGITNDQIAVLTSWDAWEGHVTSTLDNAFLRVGLTKAALVGSNVYRRPYAAIFEGASNNESSAKAVEVSYENTSNQPYAEIVGYLIEGTFVATGSQPNALFRPQGDSEALVVDSQGRIGIGTITPNSLFHLENDAPVITVKATNLGSGLRFNSIDQNGDLFRFQKDGITQWVMNSSGNVGIGTITPDNKLDVKGTIRAEEVKVETGWADYVFHEDYELKPLSEVSTYIEENHHLPGIPTAEEVAENGIKLGEMNAKLLEKIEELTLYLIEKDREIERLQKRDQQLIERIEKLEKESEP